VNIERIIEFARGGGMKAAPKARAKAGSAVANVAGALGGGGCGNGTHNGKRGFQAGNKCAGGKRDSAVARASRSHQSARRAVTKHVKAGTLHSAEGRVAVRAAATAHRELQAARDAHKAGRGVAQKEARAVASGRASAIPAKGAAPTPAPAAKPTPHPTVKARVEKSIKEASKAKADRATQHLKDLHTGARFGAFKPTEIHAHVERIARGATKDELFAAAKAAGVSTAGITTKKALAEYLKGHAHSLARPTPASPATMPTREFAAKVVQAAHASPTGGVGDSKTMISHVKAHLDAADPAFRSMSEADFKAKLVEAHLGKHLELGRADLVESMHPGDVKASKTQHQNVDFHFVRHPAAAKEQSLSDHARGLKTAKPQVEPTKPTEKPKAEAPKAPAEPHPGTATGSRLEHLVHSAGTDSGARKKAARQFVDEAASSKPLDQHVLGTDGPQQMHSVSHQGVAYYFPATPAGRQKAADKHHQRSKDVVGAIAKDHPSLANARIVGAAKAGKVAIYGEKYGDKQHQHVAHEMSHNFARAIYGSTSPAPGSDFHRAMTSGEKSVSAYGSTSPGEDFATSFQAYYADKSAFRRSHPARFAVVDRLVKDPHYGG
jgi:hypothetical protein